jgi:hypothetical protein
MEKHLACALFVLVCVAPSAVYGQGTEVMRGVKAVSVYLYISNERVSGSPVDVDLLKAGVEGLLRNAGLATSSSENRLFINVVLSESTPDRLVGVYANTEFLRTAAVQKQVAGRYEYANVPMNVWQESSFGAVGPNAVAQTIWDTLKKHTTAFIQAHADANAGYQGPALKEIPHDSDHSFEGLQMIELHVDTDPRASIDRDWAAKVLESKLAGTDVKVVGAALLHRLVIETRTYDLGYRWLTLIKGTYFRPGIIQMPGKAEIFAGDVWSHTLLATIGKAIFDIRGDVQEILDQFVAELRRQDNPATSQ